MSSTIEQADNAAVSLFGNRGMPHTRMTRSSKFFTRPEKYVLAITPAAHTPFQRNLAAALERVLFTAKATLDTQRHEIATQSPEQTPSETFAQRPNAYGLVLPPKGELFQRNGQAAEYTISKRLVEIKAEQKAAQIKEEVNTFFATEKDAFLDAPKTTSASSAQQKVLMTTSSFFAQSSQKDKEEAIQHVSGINIPGVA